MNELGMIKHEAWTNNGGRGGIRTHGTVARTPDFESGAFDQLSHPSVDSKKQGGEDIVNTSVVDDVSSWPRNVCMS
jgi:hypothetical protein